MAKGGIEAYVVGRVGADLYPVQLRTRLEDVRTFERFVGGFAGNVATGLARLGVDAAIISAVGDDGHGRFVRRFLADEGVDVRWLGTHPTLRTALAFCEAWPPDHFPITFYRTPTCPDWEVTADDIPLDAVAEAPLVYLTGTGLAREPSRTAHLTVLGRRAERTRAEQTHARQTRAEPGWTILDLDFRAVLWERVGEYPHLIREAAALVDTVVGGVAEFEAAGLQPKEALELGARLVIVKRGADGATVIEPGGSTDIEALAVPVVNGLGAGDAFAAGFGAALLAGLSPAESARRGNAAGAIVASRLSCSSAMPRPDEIDRMLDGAPLVDGEVGGQSLA